MKVVIAVIALILFILLARFVYLKVRTTVSQPVQDNVLPIPSPSYFPAFSPTPSPKATGTGIVKTSPKPSTSTTSGQLGSLPQTGSNDLAYLAVGLGVGVLGLALRKAYATT